MPRVDDVPEGDDGNGGWTGLGVLLAAVAIACFLIGAGAYLIAGGAHAVRDVQTIADGWRA